jgi:signal transduction histidine kinase
LPDEAPSGDVVAAEMLINDALDSAIAITQGLAALTDYVQQLREEFLATTVHDVRQPLTVILGETHMLAGPLSRSATDPERLHGGVKRIEASARRMMAMLEMLTDMSRIAPGSLDLQLGEANLQEIVSDVLIHCSAADAGRTLVRVRQGAELAGAWDRARLMQVVENLLNNACKYSASGTKVEIDLDADEDTAVLVIRDRGIGVPAEDLKTIFSRYQRSSNAVDSGIAGSGLGLYLCKGIIEAHGGQIETEPGGPGEGTTITVRLPRRANQETHG